MEQWNEGGTNLVLHLLATQSTAILMNYGNAMATPRCPTIRSLCATLRISVFRTENKDGHAVEVSKVPFPLTLRAGDPGGTMHLLERKPTVKV